MKMTTLLTKFPAPAVCLLVAVCRLSAQIEVISSGNVGIGTTTPASKLVIKPASDVPQLSLWQYNWDGGFEFKAPSDGSLGIYRSTVSVPRLFIDPNGNVGIGTTMPDAKLEINGGISIKDGSTFALRRSQGIGNYSIHYAEVGPHYPMRFVGSSDPTYHRYFEFGYYFGDNQANAWNANFVVDSYSGNVGIGTQSPTYKLEVVGSVRATSFISDTTTYADFVFKPGYQLTSLAEVERHINEHGTLPGVPSEAQVAKEGIDLAAMQVKLLQKIEELTLHVIALEKRTRSLEEENARLKNQR